MLLDFRYIKIIQKLSIHDLVQFWTYWKDVKKLSDRILGRWTDQWKIINVVRNYCTVTKPHDNRLTTPCNNKQGRTEIKQIITVIVKIFFSATDKNKQW